MFDWSTTARKVVVITESTMSKSKTVLEMTAAGLNRRTLRRRATDALTADGVIQLSRLSSYAVLEVVEISHACFLFLHHVLQYVLTL